MFIAVVGTCFSGKTTVEEYYINRHSFTRVQIQNTRSPPADEGKAEQNGTEDTNYNVGSTVLFPSAQDCFLHVTKHWRDNFITVDLSTRHLVETFNRRPSFILLNIDAPILTRFGRSKHPSLEGFVRSHDRDRSLQQLVDLIDVQVENSFESILDLYNHLDMLNLLDPELLRPGWDAYFMTLASLASRRSNCMKRRVGAVIVRDNRVVSTGYNGTPRGLLNCNEGGCPQCNMTSNDLECVCLHAEENALLEAGRERAGTNSVLYCNTCPCLKCTVKIIQTGVKTVVYNLTYKVDDASASLFREAGVELRRFNPNKRSGLQVPTSLQGPRLPL